MEFETAVAIIFATCFYLITTYAVRRTWRVIGANPIIMLRHGTLEDRVSVVGMWLFPAALILSTVQPGVGLFRLFMSSPVLGVLGTMFLLGGLVLMYVAISTLGAAFRIGIDRTQRSLLVRHGPYRYVRHPVYTAFLGFYLGAWLLQPNALFSVLLPVAALRLTYQALREERALVEMFGREYEVYMASTPRFLPGIL